MEQDRTKFWYLKDIFNNLTNEEVKVVDQYCAVRNIKKGEILYLQGSAGNHVYILKEGVVKITKMTPQGKELILDIFKGGTIFGECPFAESDDRDESAVVVADGLMGMMKKEDIRQLMQKIPNLSIQITRLIGFRRVKIQNRLINLLFKTVEQRLAKILINLTDDFGVPYNDGYLLKIKLTHKDYAALIASTRETVTATFGRLKNEGLIGFQGKYVVIEAPQRLRMVAEETMM